MKRLLLLPTLGVLLALILTGCENQLEAPNTLTLQTKNAVEILPANVQVVGMVDVQAMHGNTSLFPHGADEFSFDDLGGELGARIQAFLEATGFDPMQDVQHIYVAMTEGRTEPIPNVVAYASFDQDRMENYIDQNLDQEVTRSDHNGVTVYRAHQKEESMFFALAAESMVVASTEVGAVHAMLDRLAEEGHALEDDAETIDLITLVSQGSSAWMVARNVGNHVPQHAMSGKALEKSAQQIGQAIRDLAISFTVEEDGADATVILTPADRVNTDDVETLTKGFIAALKAAPDTDEVRLRFLDEMKVNTKGEAVRVSFFVDSATATSLR